MKPAENKTGQTILGNFPGGVIRPRPFVGPPFVGAPSRGKCEKSATSYPRRRGGKRRPYNLNYRAEWRLIARPSNVIGQFKAYCTVSNIARSPMPLPLLSLIIVAYQSRDEIGACLA